MTIDSMPQCEAILYNNNLSLYNKNQTIFKRIYLLLLMLAQYKKYNALSKEEKTL